MIGETWHNFYVNWKLLYSILSESRLNHYEGPETAKQFYRFTQATL